MTELKPHRKDYQDIKTPGDENENTASPKSTDLKGLIVGHIFLFLMLISRFTAAIMAQMALSGRSIFAMNSIRFSVQAIITLVIGVLLKHSLKVQKGYWRYAVGAMVIHTVPGILYYFTMSSMPAGNAYASFIAFYVIFSTVFDFCKNSIDKVAVVTTFIAVIDIITLIQPWALKKEGGVSILPCSFIESHEQMAVKKMTNASNILNTVNDHPVTHQLVGYTFILITSICTAAYSNLIKTLVSQHPFTLPNVLLGLFGAAVSFLITLTQKELLEEPLYSFSGETMCLLFLGMFTICACTSNLFEACCLKYIHVSEVAVSSSLLTVLFYVSQRTFLSTFHPGHANTLEIIGILIIIATNIATTVNRFIIAEKQ